MKKEEIQWMPKEMEIALNELRKLKEQEMFNYIVNGAKNEEEFEILKFVDEKLTFIFNKLDISCNKYLKIEASKLLTSFLLEEFKIEKK